VNQELLAEHFTRHEFEAKEEGFMDVSDGELARIFAPEHLAKAVGEPGWSRIWTVGRDGRVVAHASTFDLGQGDIVFGHIGIERPYRGQGIAKELQRSRFAFLDEHGLTLTGAVFPGNAVSLRGCLANGFKILEDFGNGLTWVFRPPGQSPRSGR
jgi:RimJ/RimL family protein N-acetyltransferase